MKVINQFKPSERRQVKAYVLNLKELRKKQLDLLERNLIKPLKDSIKADDDFLKGRVPLEKVLSVNQATSKQVFGFFKAGLRQLDD